MASMWIADAGSIEKNNIVGTFTRLALEEFDFMLNSLNRQLSDDEKQDLIYLLFDTIAEVADAAAAEKIDLRMIQTHNSITIPVRMQEVDIASRWFAQRARSIEEYMLFITHAYHVYSVTYYSVILLPYFKHKLYVPIDAEKLYLTMISDNMRTLILKHYYQKIIATPQDTENIKSLFISYAQLMFIKLLYVMYMHTKIENNDEYRSFSNYIQQKTYELMHKYNIT